MEESSVDKQPVVWFNNVTFLSDKLGECFQCRRLTYRVDVCYESHYCGSKWCEDEIDRTLRDLAETEESTP